MPEVGLNERIYRVIGLHREAPRPLIEFLLEGGTPPPQVLQRRVWRYTSEPDAKWRAQQLEEKGDLIEFSYADVEWKPAPSAWLTHQP